MKSSRSPDTLALRTGHTDRPPDEGKPRVETPLLCTGVGVECQGLEAGPMRAHTISASLTLHYLHCSTAWGGVGGGEVGWEEVGWGEVGVGGQ